MKISFLGAARTVTGSMYLLTVNQHQVLLECGLYEGRRQEAFERNRNFPFDPAHLSAVILSHAHIDHSGNLPALVRDGFSQSIFCTFATRDLCAAMLLDSGHIQESDAAYVNKKRTRQGLPPVEPFYTQQDAVRSLQNFAALGYHRPFVVVPGVTCTFYDAGHILGSAVIVLDLEENGRKVRLTFTGDLGRPHMPILRDPESVPDSEALIVESTYGNRTHEAPEEARQTLERVVNETYRKGGKVIIPAFAVGKTQDLIYDLHQLMLKQDIPSLPIYVDSPLAVNVTEVFKLHPECYDAEITQLINQHDDPFGFSRLYYIRQVEDSKALNFLREPAVIISASGMAETGRILHHLKNSIEDPRNTVLIVGYQAENTLGRRIQERRPTVSIFGEQYSLRAAVEVITGYSAHADRDELLQWVRAGQGPKPQRAFVVHGEEEAALALAQDLIALGIQQVTVPQRNDSIEL